MDNKKSVYEETSFRRKQQQASGECPSWVHTAGMLLMYQKGYLNASETLKQRYEAISESLSKYVDNKLPLGSIDYATWNEAFFDMLWKGWVSLSTPALTNIGRVDTSAHGVACSGVHLENSIESFYSARKENALLTKSGYGCSWCLDDVAPRGTIQKSGVKATGVTMPMLGAVQDMADISQASRRGSIGQYINVLHPDFREVIEHLNAENHGLNIGWNITDQFIELFDRDYELAQDIFSTTLQTKMRTGKGYYLFLDKINRNKPQMYVDRGFKVDASNLCVTGDTKLLTDNGYVPIQSVAGTDQTIWDGKEWVEVPVFKTSDGQKVLKVTLDNGSVIEATPYHRWYVLDKETAEKTIVETQNLKGGETLVPFKLDIVTHGYRELEDAFEVGYRNKRVGDTDFVPDSNYTLKSRLKWLEGRLAGAKLESGWDNDIKLVTGLSHWFDDTVFLLQELGCYATVKKREDGCYHLTISKDEIEKLKSIGFLNCMDEYNQKNNDKEYSVEVVSVVDEGKVEPTYCVKNEVNDTVMFNGVQTLNCSEVTLFADKDHSFTCVLAAMNVAKFDEWKDTKAVTIATVMLDCIIEDMLEKSKGKPYFDKVVRFTKNTRAIGLGQMGLFTYLQKNNVVVGSVEAMGINHKVVDRLESEAFTTSQWLAKELGEPEYLKGYGHRFSHLLAFAPNKSTSLIMGGISEGINPVYANVFMQDTAGSSFMRVNPVLLELMKDKGVYNKANLDFILKDNGSVQQVDWLDDHEKAVFRTAFEINQGTLLSMNSARQQVMSRNKMGQSQSFNFFFQKEATEEYIAELHKEAFLDPWCFSLYYAYSLTKPSAYIADAVCEGCAG